MIDFRFVAVAIALCSCAPIQQTSNLSTPVGQTIRAGVGDVILRAEGRESLPNVFGRADLFGRTRSTGLVVVQYGGLRNQKAILLRSGVATQSDATTMNSTGVLIANRQNTVYIPPSQANVTALQQPSIPIEIDWQRDPRVQIGSQTIIVEAADERSIVYHVE